MQLASPDPNKRDRDLLGITTGFLILYLVFQSSWLLYIALAVGLAGVFVPVLARWIQIAWTQLTTALGWLNARIILSALFFLILVPIAWLYRRGKKDPMFLKGKRDSYFQERNHRFGKEEMRKMW